LAEVRKNFPAEKLVLKIDAEGAECPILLRAPEKCFASIRDVVFEYHTFAGCGLDAIRKRIEVFGFEYAAYAEEADLLILRRRED
jgi:hypothetical protein